MSLSDEQLDFERETQRSAPPASGYPTAHLIVLGGPTAVGKTAAAIAVARRFGGEVVSADSRQVYRGMDVGTAKPTAEEQAAAPHHLIDIVDPDDDFSLAQYVALAREAIGGILGRGRLPILAGGTPLYLNAVAEGWRVPHAPPDPALRAELEAEAAREGLAALEARLAAVDPVAAARSAGNMRRVVRALEVYLTTGVPMSAQEGKESPPYCVHTVILTLDRQALHARIDARVERMVAAGLVDEVRGLIEQGYAPALPSMSGIGYAEVATYLGGECSLLEAIERIKFNTHRYVRHQETWFRRNRAAQRIDVAPEDWLARLIDDVGTVLATRDGVTSNE
jgi:tRNA dimethylallyltransferase